MKPFNRDDFNLATDIFVNFLNLNRNLFFPCGNDTVRVVFSVPMAVGIDVDGDGFIRYDEFFSSPTVVRYYDSGAITIPTRTVSVQRSYFTGIDRDRNGLIDADELMEVSPSVNQTVYTSVDTNGDGVVSYDELYGTKWFTTAVEEDSIITPAYVYRYYAPKG